MKKYNLPFPPSTNTYYRSVKNRVMISKAGRAYKNVVQQMVRISRPMEGNLSLHVDLFMPDKRRRDIDNFAGKALLDALQSAGLYHDDSQIKELHVRICGIEKGGRVAISIGPILELKAP